MSDTVDRVGVFAQLAIAISAVFYPIVKLIDHRLERRRRELEKRYAELEERIERIEVITSAPARVITSGEAARDLLFTHSPRKAS